MNIKLIAENLTLLLRKIILEYLLPLSAQPIVNYELQNYHPNAFADLSQSPCARITCSSTSRAQPWPPRFWDT